MIDFRTQQFASESLQVGLSPSVELVDLLGLMLGLSDYVGHTHVK
jgi:hypothetical protein